MTTLFPVERTCAVCGATSQQTVIGSTNSFGSADLDTRPPEMMRSTIFYWVERCPSCGYCAKDIGELEPGAREVVYSEAYRDQLNLPGYPARAIDFQCMALLQSSAGELASAGWSSLRAAWICDDTNDDEHAQECRWQAYNLFQEALQAEQQIAQQNGAGTAVMIDLLRRSGRFEWAMSIAEEGIQRAGLEQIFYNIFRFQYRLAGQRDRRCYTIAQALSNEETQSGDPEDRPTREL